MRGPTFDALKCDTLRIGHDPTVALSHVWIPATCFFSRANAQRHCWLWLLRGDGQVRALLVPAEHFGRDDLLPELLRLSQREDTLRIAHPALHGACALPDAPIVPLPRWVISWGHPVQRAIRAFADGLDADVLEALGELEVRGAFFGTVQNYNRLARAPAPARARRMLDCSSDVPMTVARARARAADAVPISLASLTTNPRPRARGGCRRWRSFPPGWRRSCWMSAGDR